MTKQQKQEKQEEIVKCLLHNGFKLDPKSRKCPTYKLTTSLGKTYRVRFQPLVVRSEVLVHHHGAWHSKPSSSWARRWSAPYDSIEIINNGARLRVNKS